MGTTFTKLIDWKKGKTYEDLADLLFAYAEDFERSDVSSGSGNFVDGHAKRDLLKKLRDTAAMLNSAPDWIYVRPDKNYTHNEGHIKTNGK